MAYCFDIDQNSCPGKILLIEISYSKLVVEFGLGRLSLFHIKGLSVISTPIYTIEFVGLGRHLSTQIPKLSPFRPNNRPQNTAYILGWLKLVINPNDKYINPAYITDPKEFGTYLLGLDCCECKKYILKNAEYCLEKQKYTSINTHQGVNMLPLDAA